MHFDRNVQILIIGGGAIGCSLAYQLARRGTRDVLLLEKSRLTDGCTWHAAGLVGQLRGKKGLTQLMRNSVAVFDRLEAESGMAIDWRKVGSLRLAGSPARWGEIRRAITLARSFGFEAHEVSVAEALEIFPYMVPDGIVGAAFMPSDGYVDPYSLTQAYAGTARKHGARLEENICVTGIIRQGRSVTGVVTDHGTIGCDILVNCAGLWAKRIGEMAGVALAAGVVEHQYFLTEKKLDLPKTLPTLRDPDNNFYLKPDVGAFAIGGWEAGTKGCWRSRPPFEFGRELFPENMERLERFAMPCATRIPLLNDIGIQSIINGPIPASADGEPIMGLVPELDNFYVACGFTAGIAASGGAGEAMANWILEGDPGLDLWNFDVRRFGAPHAVGRYLEDRAIDAYGQYYQIHWPGEEVRAARGVRRSPLYAALKAKGAVFGARFGWERALWFARAGDPQEDVPSFEDKPNWFEAVGAEHRAIREAVVLIDQTSFGKTAIEGPGAFDFLQGLTTANLTDRQGRCIYTQMLNDNGGIEADITLLFETPERFTMISGAGFMVRDVNCLQKHLPEDNSVRLRDATSERAVINICGPRARDVLQRLTDSDLSNEAFPFLTARTIEIGYAAVLAARIGYVGELGYELHVPVEYAGYLYEVLSEAGQPEGIRDVGYRAIESCRLEKFYLYWSSDISPYTNPLEAGLGGLVSLKKGFFRGRSALEAFRAAGPRRKLCTFTLDGFVPLHGAETILHGCTVAGQVTSAGFGYTIGKTIAYGYLPIELADERTFEILAFGKPYQANRTENRLYDPANVRLTA
jgi:glycine cleavage system aminomethyltransferase T/glycine/D-amino acid oxidase-like deaminating enzyme